MADMQMLKLESPPYFEGQHNMEKVESWVYQIKNYFVLAMYKTKNLKDRCAILLLTKSAAIWLHIRGYDLQTLAWQQLKMDIMDIFKPADYHWHARGKLATCV